MIRYDLRRLLDAPKWRLLGCAAALALAAGPVSAQVTDPAFDRFRAQVVGNNVNFSYGGAGTPLAGAGNTTGIGVASGVDVSRNAAINTKHGPINGTLVQKISSSQMGKAFGRAAALVGGPLGLAFFALPAVVDWLTDRGVTVVDGQPMKPESRHPTYDDEWEYRYNASSAWHLSAMSACNDWIAANSGGQFSWRAVTFSAPTTCQAERNQQGFDTWYLIGQSITRRARQTEPLPPSYEPVSPAELETMMGGIEYPTPEQLKAVLDAGGNPIPDLVDTIRGEFEARSPESVTETSTSTPTEDKTEEKRCATYTQWVGQTLSLVEQCATTTTTQEKDPITGDPVGDPKVTTSTTTDTTPDAKAKEDSDESLLCKAFPKIAACAELDTPTGEVPQQERTITYAAENLGFGGGSCPEPFTWEDSLGTHALDLAPYCDKVSGVIRPLVLLMAMLAAFFIVAPVWSNQS